MHCHLTAIFDAWYVWCFLWSQLTACELRLRSTSGYHFGSKSVVSIVTGKTTLASLWKPYRHLIFNVFHGRTHFVYWQRLCEHWAFHHMGNLYLPLWDKFSGSCQVVVPQCSSMLPACIYSWNSLEPGHGQSFYVPRACSLRSRVSKAELIAVYSLCTWAKLHS